jgi:hypothetical protein
VANIYKFIGEVRNEQKQWNKLLLFFRASGTHGVRICSGQGKKSKILIVKKEAYRKQNTTVELPGEMF